LGAWWLAATLLYVGTTLLHRRHPRHVALTKAPKVSVIVPVKGIGAELADNFDALFQQSYADFEILFVVADSCDPAIALIEAAIVRHSGIPARLIIGDDKVSGNPKVNNLAKGEHEARHELLMMCDSNITIQPDMLSRMVARLVPPVGLISTIPVAVRPSNFVGELECAMFNGFTARLLFAADFVGIVATVGKIMLLRKRDLARIGGIPAMGKGLCEDSVLGTAIRAIGLETIVMDEPAFHPVGNQRFRNFWDRHLRWHCCRRCHHMASFIAEPFFCAAGATLAGGIFWNHMFAAQTATAIFIFLAGWFALEALYLMWKGWSFSWQSPAAWIVRELLLPVLWLHACVTRSLNWRGNRLNISDFRRSNTVA
jgi:ceramide glucosyltransferase